MTREKKLETALAETLDALTRTRQALSVLEDAYRFQEGAVESAMALEGKAREVLMSTLERAATGSGK